MILIKTPYRISFFGGGSDYHHWYEKNAGEVLSTTIDKYIYLYLNKTLKFFDHRIRLSYAHIEEVKKIDEIKHLAIKKALKFKKINNIINIHYAGDLPGRSGMGSSSSFVVGLLNGLNYLNGDIKSKKELATESIYFEQKVLKEIVGCQDQIAAAYGGFNYLKFKGKNFAANPIKNKSFLSNLNKNTLLLYTGRQRFAQEIARKFVRKLNNEKKIHILEILDLVKISKKLIHNNDHKSFGLLLEEGWKIKRSLDKSISNSTLDTIYNKAKRYGSLGGKLLGAGAGGFFLFYVPQEKQKFFLKKMKPLLNVPFNFSSNGSTISEL